MCVEDGKAEQRHDHWVDAFHNAPGQEYFWYLLCVVQVLISVLFWEFWIYISIQIAGIRTGLLSCQVLEPRGAGRMSCFDRMSCFEDQILQAKGARCFLIEIATLAETPSNPINIYQPHPSL